jgi:hypothetical protein
LSEKKPNGPTGIRTHDPWIRFQHKYSERPSDLGYSASYLCWSEILISILFCFWLIFESVGSTNCVFQNLRFAFLSAVGRKPFDRTPFDWKVVWPNHYLIERRLTKSLFQRKVIWSKNIYQKVIRLNFLSIENVMSNVKSCQCPKISWKVDYLTEMSMPM